MFVEICSMDLSTSHSSVEFHFMYSFHVFWMSVMPMNVHDCCVFLLNWPLSLWNNFLNGNFPGLITTNDYKIITTLFLLLLTGCYSQCSMLTWQSRITKLSWHTLQIQGHRHTKSESLVCLDHLLGAVIWVGTFNVIIDCVGFKYTMSSIYLIVPGPPLSLFLPVFLGLRIILFHLPFSVCSLAPSSW